MAILPVARLTTTTLAPEERQISDSVDQSVQVTEEEITPSRTTVAVMAIQTLAPEGTGDTPTQTVSQTESSVGNR